MGIRVSWWQIFLTTPGMISVINSVLVGVFVGLLLSYFFALSLLVCTIVGVVAFLISVGIHQRYHWRHFKRTDPGLPVLFPSEVGR